MKKYWNTIKRKYPNAFAQLCKDHNTIEQWGEIDSPTIWGIFVDEPKWVLRHLFDFFDSRKINSWCMTTDGKLWSYGILTKGRLFRPSVHKYNSRESAEMALYLKCFQILEQKLAAKKHEKSISNKKY